MRVIAIETVETTGSVAALEDDSVVAQRPLDHQRRSAQTLAPGLDELLRGVGWQPADVELVAVATGPGSFTGLRIGVTTAKTLAYAVGCPVVGVHTLLAIGTRIDRDLPRFTVVLDAQRSELFVADFSRGPNGQVVGHETTRLVGIEAWLGSLTPGAVVTGPGLAKVAERLPQGVVALPPALWSPTAAIIGQVGFRLFSAGERTSVFDLVPQYFRRTAAEEQWEKKHA